MTKSDIQIKHFGHKIYEGLSFGHTAYTHYQFPKHFHNHYTILLIEQGVNEGFTEKVNYKIGKGGILIINPGELHAGTSFENQYLKFQSLRISAQFIHEICRKHEIQIRGDIIFQNSPIYDVHLTQQMYRLLMQRGESTNFLQTETHHTELFSSLLFKYSNQQNCETETKPAKKTIEKAKAYLYENYQNNILLQDLAEHAGLSRYHLIRQFKKYYGLSPFQYLRNLRVEKAKELLQLHYPITQIALEVGFFDHSHFLRNFKKIEGISPSGLRINPK